MEVDGEDGDAALDDAGKSDGDAIEVRKRGAEFIEGCEYDLGRGSGGVAMRRRWLTELPAASSSMALSPEPPMSMASVTGRVGLGETTGVGAVGTAGATGAAAGVETEVAICRNCTTCGRDCNWGIGAIFTGAL